MLLPTQAHVNVLYLQASESLFHVEIQADQRERHRYRLRVLCSELSAVRITTSWRMKVSRPRVPEYT
jgi:hypothetical protein